MPRRPAKGQPSKQSNGMASAARTPRAGDAARQIGEGFFKMADVIDECPPLAKLFEGGFLERRFQQVFQLQSGGMGAVLATGGSSSSNSTGTSTAGSERAREASVSEDASSARHTSSSSSAPDRGADGGSAPRQGERKARGAGRRGWRERASLGEAEAWPGMEQALAASEVEVSRSANAGVRARPAAANTGGFAQERGERPSLPVPSFAYPPAPPPRAAAAVALQRISSPRTSPLKARGVTGKNRSPSEGNAASRCGVVSVGAKRKVGRPKGSGKRGGGGDKETVAGRGKGTKNHSQLAGPRRQESREEGKKPSKSTHDGAGGVGKNEHAEADEGSGKRKNSSDDETSSRGASTTDGHEHSGHKRGRRSKEKVRAAEVEPGSEAGATAEVRRRRSEEEMLKGLDLRVFTPKAAGECREEGCELRGEAHCHRGPGCDCTRNSETYRMPSEYQSMMRHQERHHDWNKRPAFGKRVLVKFDGIFYPGTINTEGVSAKDRKHSRGRWGVLFDDCTRDRFDDDASDVMITNHPRPMEINAELREYYARQENGEKLLVGIKTLPSNAKPASKSGSATPYKSNTKKSRGSKKNVRHDGGGSCGDDTAGQNAIAGRDGVARLKPTAAASTTIADAAPSSKIAPASSFKTSIGNGDAKRKGAGKTAAVEPIGWGGWETAEKGRQHLAAPKSGKKRMLPKHVVADEKGKGRKIGGNAAHGLAGVQKIWKTSAVKSKGLGGQRLHSGVGGNRTVGAGRDVTCEDFSGGDGAGILEVAGGIQKGERGRRKRQHVEHDNKPEMYADDGEAKRARGDSDDADDEHRRKHDGMEALAVWGAQIAASVEKSNGKYFGTPNDEKRDDTGDGGATISVDLDQAWKEDIEDQEDSYLSHLSEGGRCTRNQCSRVVVSANKDTLHVSTPLDSSGDEGVPYDGDTTAQLSVRSTPDADHTYDSNNRDPGVPEYAAFPDDGATSSAVSLVDQRCDVDPAHHAASDEGLGGCKDAAEHAQRRSPSPLEQLTSGPYRSKSEIRFFPPVADYSAETVVPVDRVNEEGHAAQTDCDLGRNMLAGGGVSKLMTADGSHEGVGGGGSGGGGGGERTMLATAAMGKANGVPVLLSSASDPHALEVAHVMISGMGMIGPNAHPLP